MKIRVFFQRLRILFFILSAVCLILAIFLLRKFALGDSTSSYDLSSDYVENVNHRVLLLCSYNSQYYTYNAQIDGFYQGLYNNGVEFDVMFMDGKNYNTEEDHRDFYTFFKARMKSENNYEGVIVVDDEAIKFVCDNKKELFGDLPVIFIGANDFELAQRAASTDDITGFYENDFLSDTVTLAMSIMPDRNKIYGFFDNSVAGRSDGERFSHLSESFPDYAFRSVDVSQYTEGELNEEMMKIPDDAIVIYMTCFTDKDNINHSIYEMSGFFKKYCAAPVIRSYDDGVGYGALGSVGLDFTEQAKRAGELMVKVLNGADIDKIPLFVDSPAVIKFDYELMEKFGINENDLPGDVYIYNKPITFWDRYAGILPSVGLMFMALIFLLMSAYASAYEGKRINKELLDSKDELEKSHEKLQYQAEHDEFLDILNRRSAVDYLREHTNANGEYSILMVDIDNFKDVNETYGHQLADEVLKYISYELEQMVAKRDWMLARYGGDEFLIFVSDERLTEDCKTTKDIMEIFSRPIPLRDETIIMSSSIGISVSDGFTIADQHIINAEIAMYEAKLRGRNKAFIYSDEMKKKVRDENKIKARILDALENDGFYMVYQPQVNTETLEITGYEALIRMKTEGMYPGVFIPIAESSGWIARIGRLTTELVIKQLAKWRSEGYPLHPVSINFSSNQINDMGYVSFLKGLLDEYKIPAEYVEIEVTEGLFLEKTEKADKLFKELGKLGIKLLMDDFGTGYSSLGYLTYIPVDIVKLDKSLVDAYLVEGKDAFIKDVIHLVHDLDKKIIIEGVEEKRQYDKLKEFDADIIQGFYFSRPLMPENAIVFKAQGETNKVL